MAGGAEVSERRQARLDAMVALLAAGWAPERVALALSLSRATVERLASPPVVRLPVRPGALATGTCCQLVDGLACDAPVEMLGSVFCDTHYRPWACRERSVAVSA